MRPVLPWNTLAHGPEFFRDSCAGVVHWPGKILFPAIKPQALPVIEEGKTHRQMADTNSREIVGISRRCLLSPLPEFFSARERLESQIRSRIFSQETAKIKVL